MKQPQYSPLSISDMAISLFSANEGYLDDVGIDKIVAFEAGLHAYMAENRSELVAQVNADGDWNDDRESAFHEALKAYKETGTW
jgi:F-type H+-transporting ATPase subunit alpha